MSAYDYDAPPRRSYREESYREEQRLRPDPRYEPQETYYRQKTTRHELVPRAREDSDLSIEEVRRDFPPPGYSRDIGRARSADPRYDDYYSSSRDLRTRQKPGSVYYEEEERTRKRVLTKEQKIMAAVLGGVIAAGAKEAWDRKEAKDEGRHVERNPLASAALAAGGAFAGYEGADLYSKRSEKEDKKSTYVVHKGRDGRVSEYYSDEDEDPRGRKGNKNFLENALSAAGLGGAIKALTGGGGDDKRSEGRSRRGSVDSRSSRRSRSEDTPANRMQKAAKASLVAGAAEAFRVSKEPGGWKGEKMKRVLTAAAGAAAIDGAHDPSKGDNKRHMLEAVVGGLVGNRMLHGSRKDIEEDQSTGRSRSRSRSRGDSGGGKSGIAALATAGLGALGAKKLMDNRSRSRSRSRRSRSRGSYDSRSPSPRRRSRSRSVVDTARRSLAKIGLGSAPEEEEGRSSSRRSRGHDDRYDDDKQSTRDGYMSGGRGDRDRGYDERDSRRRSGSRSRRGGRSSSVSSSDLGDSDQDEKTMKKMKGKQLLKGAMATVATVHAVNNVYSSVQARNARHQAVRKGELNEMEAKKLKSKAILQDAAAVGIALISIKGVVSEMKEVKEKREECHEWQSQKQKRHEKRLERLKRANSDLQHHHDDDYVPRSRADGWSSSAPMRGDRYDDGPRYTDGNPYSASIPAPPVGYDRR